MADQSTVPLLFRIAQETSATHSLRLQLAAAISWMLAYECNEWAL